MFVIKSAVLCGVMVSLVSLIWGIDEHYRNTERRPKILSSVRIVGRSDNSGCVVDGNLQALEVGKGVACDE